MLKEEGFKFNLFVFSSELMGRKNFLIHPGDL
jgi:hypothetical protein